MSMLATALSLQRKVCAGLFLFTASACYAQGTSDAILRPGNNDSAPTYLAAASLPDSPGASLGHEEIPASEASSGFDQAGLSVPAQIAPKYKRTIQAGQTAVPLTSADKLVFALHLRVTPVALASTLFSAGYAHLTDSRPHYGTDSAGFGERLGGSELRQTSQSLFTYGIYASLFHDDPRYYVLGRNEPFKKRAIYAAERVVITRKDNGHHAINWPQLMGTASAQALANAYYPSRDQSVRKTVTGTLSSYGTSAAINEVNEFLGDVIAHFRHKPQP